MRIFSLLFILVFLFLYKLFLLNEIFFLRDFGVYFYPLKHLILSFFKSGILPFWNSYIDFGVPLLADLQAQILYLPSLFLLFGLPFGLCLFILFHFLLASFSCYILARSLNLCVFSSFVSACVFIFSGWFISSIDILTVLAASSWIPLIFYLFLKKRTNFTGFAIAFQFLSGEPSILYGTIISLFFYSIYKKAIKRFILAGLIGFAISLFQSIPFLEFVSLSFRSEMSLESATYWSFPPYKFLRFFIPSLMESPIDRTFPISDLFNVQLWLNSPYLGIISILLISLSFKERRGMFFFILSFIFLIFSFGKYTPLYDIFASLPFFGLPRYPVKFISIFTFALSILAGYGFSLICEKKGFFLFLISSLIFACFLLFLFFGKHEIILYMEKYASSLLFSAWIKILFKDVLFLFIILSLSFFLILLLKYNKIKKSVFAFCFIGLIITDLFFFSSRLNPTTSAEIYQFKPRVSETIKNQRGIFRVLVTPLTKKHLMEPTGTSFEEIFLKRLIYLMPNLGLIHKIFYASSYRSISLSDYSRFMQSIELSEFSFVSHLVSLINTRYIISDQPLKEKSLRFLLQDGEKGPFLYENMNCLPRAFIVYNFKIIKDRYKTLEYMLDELDPAKEIVLEEEPEKKVKSQKSKVKSEVEIIKYESNKVVIEVDAKSDGFLFLSDTYYPGWKAYVKKVKSQKSKVKTIYRANYCFRAVYIDKGKQVVEFRYFPKTFIIGLLASIISFVLIIGTFLYQNKRRYIQNKNGFQ